MGDPRELYVYNKIERETIASNITYTKAFSYLVSTLDICPFLSDT